MGLEILGKVGAVPTDRELFEIKHRDNSKRGTAGTDAESDRFGRLRQPKKLVQ
jgi:hypothetical protein